MLDRALERLGDWERSAERRSPVHRLDPRVKVLTTLAVIGVALSFPLYEPEAVLPLALYPVVMAAAAGISWRTLLGWAIPAALPAVLVGLANPWLEREPLGTLGPWPVAAGWYSWASIVLRAAIALTAGMALVATSGFDAVCRALAQVGVPPALTAQLRLMYRYLFVLLDEAARMLRARQLRAPDRPYPALREAGPLLGLLLERAVARAHRVHRAMICRGFEGRFPAAPTSPLRAADWSFLAAWGAYLVLCRAVNLPEWLGHAVLGN